MLRPLSNRVILKRIEPEEKTKSGIILSASSKEKPQMAVVIRVGPGKLMDDGKLSNMDVQEGNKVIIDKYAGNEITYNDEEFLIVENDDILAIVE